VKIGQQDKSPSCERTLIDFQVPQSTDGYAVHRLISSCPPLDSNSLYCNLLQCAHFADTAICAKDDEDLAGFVSGYRIPNRLDTLFIWQVAVADGQRGQGLAGRMLCELLQRPICREVAYLETSITPSNRASWILFDKLAMRLETTSQVSPLFEKEEHFQGDHETEILVRIGPFNTMKLKGADHENI